MHCWDFFLRSQQAFVDPVCSILIVKSVVVFNNNSSVQSFSFQFLSLLLNLGNNSVTLRNDIQ